MTKPTHPRPKALADLEGRLGYAFKDKTLLERSLTHSSAVVSGGRDNERLEFLGDRVLGLVVADTLVAQNPNFEEGRLAQALNALVRKETCVEVAKHIDLGSVILMDEAEARQGGRQKKSLLGDACEAVIAAIYIDGGFEPARDFILREWAGHFEEARSIRPDAKTALQEWAHARFKCTPDYHVLDRSGPDHAPVFVVEVRVADTLSAQGTSKSKRSAERDAARQLLEREGVWT